MFTRITLLLGVLALPVLLALASQTLAAGAGPPALPEPAASADTATVPAVRPSAPARRVPAQQAGPTQAEEPGSAPRAIPVEPRQVGTPADLDGDRDDDGIPDDEEP